MNIDNDERPTILEYVEAAYLHGLCVENLDTDELEPPRDISEVAWIAEKIEERFAAQRQALRDEVMGAVGAIGNEPMPRFGKSGKYIKSPQSFQDGFEEARAELRTAISTIFDGKKGQS